MCINCAAYLVATSVVNNGTTAGACPFSTICTLHIMLQFDRINGQSKGLGRGRVALVDRQGTKRTDRGRNGQTQDKGNGQTEDDTDRQRTKRTDRLQKTGRGHQAVAALAHAPGALADLRESAFALWSLSAPSTILRSMAGLQLVHWRHW